MKDIVLILAIVAIGTTWIIFTNILDEERAATYAGYEKCVLSEYRTTPQFFYNEHGHYPECDFNIKK